MTDDTYLDRLVDRVNARVKGTRSDPLTRDEVAKVVEATLAEMENEPTEQESP